MLKHAQTHLTADQFSELAQATLPGQAYFAGTGPLGATCGGCLHAVTKTQEGRLLFCDQHRQMRRVWGGKIRRDAPACKYFEAKPERALARTSRP
jgi:hypothetical protein